MAKRQQSLAKTPPGVEIFEEERKRIETKVTNVITQQKRDVHKTFKVYSPVCKLSTIQSASHGGESYTTLARSVIDDLQLVSRPQSFDLFQQDGQRATFNVSERKDFNNHQSMFLVSKDLLKQYLQETNQTLLWGIWGERNLLPSVGLGMESYKVFSDINHDDFST